MHVANRKASRNRRLGFQRRCGLLDEDVIERLIKAMILGLNLMASHARWQRGRVENRGEVDAFGLPVVLGDGGVDFFHSPHHLIECAEAKFGHVLAHLLGEKEEEVDYMLGLALETRAQNRILCRDAHRTGVQVAFAHHDAAHGDQRHGGEAELFGAQQRGNHHVAARLQLAVGLHFDAAAQIVQQQHLLGFGQAQFPRQSGVLDGAQGRSAGASAVAGDEHHVGMRLADAGGHRAHAHLGDQFHRDARLGIDVLQVVDQLRQVFDGINVMVRRRRDQGHAGNRVTHPGDDLIHLVPRQLAALAGLCALRHLDLQLVGVD